MMVMIMIIMIVMIMMVMMLVENDDGDGNDDGDECDVTDAVVFALLFLHFAFFLRNPPSDGRRQRSADNQNALENQTYFFINLRQEPTSCLNVVFLYTLYLSWI